MTKLDNICVADHAVRERATLPAEPVSGHGRIVCEQNTRSSSLRILPLLGILSTLGAVVLLYWSSWTELVHVWENNPNNSHGYLVPVLSLFFVWRAWRESGPPIAATVNRGTLAVGVCQLLLGLTLRLASPFVNEPVVSVLSLICVLRGLLVLLGGYDATRRFGFATLFLLFMAPLPVPWYQSLAVMLQQAVSHLSASLLLMVGVPVWQDGYVLRLPGSELEVGAACSGLTQLTAFLALTFAAAHLSSRPMWYKVALVGMSVPIAIAANCLRVTVTGIILMLVGPKWAEGIFHTLEGLAVVGIGMLLLLAFAWGLGKFADRMESRRVTESLGKTENRGMALRS